MVYFEKEFEIDENHVEYFVKEVSHLPYTSPMDHQLTYLTNLFDEINIFVPF